jgi:hypothetical protein
LETILNFIVSVIKSSYICTLYFMPDYDKKRLSHGR